MVLLRIAVYIIYILVSKCMRDIFSAFSFQGEDVLIQHVVVRTEHQHLLVR